MGTYICEANNGIPPNAKKEFRVNVLCKNIGFIEKLFGHYSRLGFTLIVWNFISSPTNAKDSFSNGWWVQAFFCYSNMHSGSLSATS